MGLEKRVCERLVEALHVIMTRDPPTVVAGTSKWEISDRMR